MPKYEAPRLLLTKPSTGRYFDKYSAASDKYSLVSRQALTNFSRQEAIDLNRASPNKPAKKRGELRMTKERERIGKMESMINQRPDYCLRLAFVEPGYQLFHHQPINNQNLSPWSILKLDQKEILIKYLDLLQNQAIKDLELKKKNSIDGDGDANKTLQVMDKNSEVLSLKEEAERAVNEKALAKVASIMSNPSQRTSFDDKPLPPVIHMAKAFESAENTPSSSHFSPNHQTSNQISEHLLSEWQPPFLNNLGPVAATNPSAQLLYEYSEHSRLSKDLSEFIVQSQEQAIS
ncbi:hypothetical protein PPACK8108_LOCUS10186 [Phakopsora pachyrhizi]|uniref:Uncharacterized protein n=1 Tax=Phakopsora pachyrhizi TaxID=170000 RepID=A0AAV0B0R0_PHAPC|nr:hypothetical protein PPACK8108_LOCUS10186 [Phakopsora pachyrhizi]